MKFPKKSNTSHNYHGDQSWHNLRDSNAQSSPIITFTSVYRRIRSYLKLGLFLLCLIIVFFYADDFIVDRIATEQVSDTNNTGNYVKKVLFDTNGVLDEKWLSEVIKINGNMKLMDLNIFEIKHKLESFDQIREARVLRVFPDILRIELEELVPILKLKMQTGDGVTYLKCVDKSGIAYEGIGYTEEFLQELPYLIPYRHSDKSYLPINGLNYVFSLIQLLKDSGIIERINLQSISLENFSGDIGFPGQIIELNSSLVPRILFSAYNDYSTQLNHLIYILSYNNGSGNPEIERVDLSLRDSAAVQFKKTKNSIF